MSSSHQQPQEVIEKIQIQEYIDKETKADDDDVDSLTSPTEFGSLHSTRIVSKDEKLPRILRFMRWFHSWPALFRCLINMAIGSGILLIPGIIDILFFVQNRNSPFIQLTSTCTIMNVPLIFWSLYISFLWSLLVLSSYTFSVLPAAFLRLVHLLLGRRYMELMRSKAELFGYLHNYLSFSLTVLVALIIWSVFFKINPWDTDQTTLPQAIGQKVLLALFLTMLLVTAEKLFLHWIAVGFHQNAYLERILGFKFADYCLERLNHGIKKRKDVFKKRNRLQQQQLSQSQNGLNHWFSFLKSGSTSPKESIKEGIKTEQLLSESGQKLKNYSASLPEMPSSNPIEEDEISIASVQTQRPDQPKPKRIMSKPFNFLNAVSDITRMKLVYQKTKGILGDVTNAAFSTLLSGSVTDTDLKTKEQALKFARELFYSICELDREEILLQDFLPYFHDVKEAKRAFRLFDQDGNGDINYAECQQAILHIYHEKTAIEDGISDLSQTVGQLNTLFMSFVILIAIFIWLSVFGITVTGYLVTAGSMLVALNIIFGNSVRSVFESILFLFMMHPYDVGDRISIDDQSFTVKKITLITTSLLKPDGTLIYVPNASLSSKFIHNYRRSPRQSEGVRLYLDVSTQNNKIVQLEEKMLGFVMKWPRDFVSKVDIFLEEFDVPQESEFKQGKLKLKVWFYYKNNFQDAGLRFRRKNKFLLALKDAIQDLSLRAKIEKQAQ